MQRYTDVAAEKGWNNILGAKEHWKEKGQKEGRSKALFVAQDDKLAKCYMDRYPDLPLDLIKRTKTG